MRRSILLAVLSVAAAESARAQNVTYTGPNDGLWSVAPNWSGGVVPNAATFNVTLPDSRTVRFDLAGPVTLGSLIIPQNGRVYTTSASPALSIAGVISGQFELFAGTFASTSVATDGINNSRFFVSGGGTLTTATSQWNGAQAYVNGAPIFQASGVGSVLNLSSLQTLRYGPDAGDFAAGQFIEAINGGTINLSNLSTVTVNPGQDDRLVFRQAGGTLQLNSLATIDNTMGNGSSYVRFNVETGTLTLPALAAARGNVELNLSANTTLNINAMVNRFGQTGSADRSTWNLATNSAVNANALTALTYTTVNGAAGATFNAPNLTNITGSQLSIPTNFNFVSGSLSTIDNARILVGAGVNFTSVTDTEWVGDKAYVNGAPIFQASGVGSVLNLSSLQTLRYGPDAGDFAAGQFIEAINGGTINLSNLSTVTVNPGQDDRLVFRQAGGTLQLNSLATIDNTMGNGSSYVRFNVETGTLTLPALAAARGNVELNLSANTTLNINAMVNRFGQTGSADRSTWNLATNSAVNANALTALTYTTVNGAAGATFNAPNLTNITGSQLSIPTNFNFVSGSLSTIDNARILVGAGVNFTSVTDTEWVGDKAYVNGAPIFQASGVGSVLNLSSLQTLRYGPDAGDFAAGQFIEAINGGTINLSNLSTVTVNPGQDDRLVFRQAGGTLQLNSLATIDNTMGNGSSYVRFNVETGTLTLPALAAARGNVELNLSANTTLNINAMVNRFGQTGSADRSTWNLATNSAVNANALTALTYTTVNTTSGANISASSLRDITGSILNIAAGSTFTAGPLDTIDDASIRLGAGKTLAVSDTRYTNPTLYRNDTIFSADGAGSVLNLSSLTDLEFGSNGVGRFTYVVRAANGGTVNLSNLQLLRVRPGEDDVLEFQAVGGTMNLSSLRPIEARGNGNDLVRFVASSGGTIQLGEMAGSQRFELITNNGTGNFSIAGGLTFDAQSTLSLAPLSVLSLPGRLTFSTTDETRFRADTAEIRITGSDVQRVEVGGNDAGAVQPGNNGNFGFGQFKIGTATQSSVVELVDVYNNGNRGSSGKEALYAYGLGGGPAGLVMNSGSLLAVGGINVYVNQNGTLVNLQSLFPSGTDLVPYTFNGSNGFILRGLTLNDGFWESPGNSSRIYWDGPSGNWDTAINWSIDLTPISSQDAYITPAAGITVSGPTANTTVRNLVVDRTVSGTSILNLNGAGVTTRVVGGLQVGTDGIVNLSQGTLDVGSTLTIGVIQTQSGTTYRTDSILNQGGMVLRGTTTAGATINNGTMTLAAGTHSFGPIVGPGEFTLAAGASGTTDRIRQALIAVNGNLVIRKRDGAEYEVSRIGALTVGATGKIDLADNPLILDSGSLSNLASLVASAYAGGTWSGPGIGSSLAGIPSRTGVGYSTAASANVTSWFGEAVDGTDLLVRLTLQGDTNLDGSVNFDDLLRVAQNYNGQGRTWNLGDFTYDGIVNFDDLLSLAQNYGDTLLMSGAVVMDPTARFEADFARAFAMVPEPTMGLALIGLATTARRRR